MELSNKLALSLDEQQTNASENCVISVNNLVVKNDASTVYDLTKYSFLSSENTPNTVNKNLYNQARLNMNVGLYKVCDGIYQIRGYDLANMTIIIEKQGLILHDVLTTSETAIAALHLLRNCISLFKDKTEVNTETSSVIIETENKNVTISATYSKGNEYHDKDLLSLASKPIKAIIISHTHVDHYAGMTGVLDYVENIDLKNSIITKNEKIEIVVPNGFMEHVLSENIYAGAAMQRRGMYMYGIKLPRGEKGQVDAGLGKATAVGTTGLKTPTINITKNGICIGVNDDNKAVDDVPDILKNIYFQLTPGTEAPAEMNTFIIDKNALFVAENACATLHNIGTLRGAQVRDSLAWADYLDETIELFTGINDKNCIKNSKGKKVTFNTVCASHHWPHFNKDNKSTQCEDFLEIQRDMYRYINNQTLHYINMGYTIDEIGRILEANIPNVFKDEWCNHGFYGTFNHDAKAVYQRYIGWYDSNPSHLNKLMPNDSAVLYVECMGGSEKILEMAENYYNNGNFAWVCELLDKVIYADLDEDKKIKEVKFIDDKKVIVSNIKKAKLLLADSLEQLGFKAESGPWRNEYLTGAMELRLSANDSLSDSKQEKVDAALRENLSFGLTKATVTAMNIKQLVQYIAILFDGMKGQDLDIVFKLNTKESYMVVKNSVISFTKTSNMNNKVIKINYDQDRFYFVFGNKCKDYQGATVNYEDLFIEPNENDKNIIKKLLNCLSKFTLAFPIVTPRDYQGLNLNENAKWR